MKLQLVVLCCAAVAAVATARSPFNLGRWARRESDALHLKPKLKEVEGAAKVSLIGYQGRIEKGRSMKPTSNQQFAQFNAGNMKSFASRRRKPLGRFCKLET